MALLSVVSITMLFYRGVPIPIDIVNMKIDSTEIRKTYNKIRTDNNDKSKLE